MKRKQIKQCYISKNRVIDFKLHYHTLVKSLQIKPGIFGCTEYKFNSSALFNNKTLKGSVKEIAILRLSNVQLTILSIA